MNEEKSSFPHNDDGISLQREQLYRSVVENTPDLITRWDHNLKLLYANPAFVLKAGVSRESLYGKDSREMGQPDEVALPWMEKLSHALVTGMTAEHYNLVPTLDGSSQFYSLIIPEKNERGKVEAILAITRDITDSKNKEQEIDGREYLDNQQTGNKYRTLFESIADGFVIFELVYDHASKPIDILLVEASPAYEGLVGLVKPAAVPPGKSSNQELLSYEDYDKVVRTGEALRIERYDVPQQQWYRIHLSRMGDPQLRRISAIFHKISSEKPDRQQTEALRTLFNSIDQYYSMVELIYDEKGKPVDLLCIEANPALSKQLGMNPIGKTASNVFGKTEPFWLDTYDRILRSGISERLEYKTDGMDGQWYSAFISPVRNAGTRCCVAVFDNVTEQKKAEQELKDFNVQLEKQVAQRTEDLRKSTEKIKEDAHFIGQVMETTPDIIYIMDLDTRQLIYSNRQVAADLGYTKKEIASMKNPVFDILYPQDEAMMIEHLKKMKTIRLDDKVIETEYRLISANGEIKWFLDRDAVFRRNNKGTPVEKIGITQNITERKQQEQHLLTTLEIMEQAEAITEMGSWEYDISTTNFRWSEGMYRLFNLPKTLRPRPEIYLDYTLEEEETIANRIVRNIREDFVPFEEIVTIIPEGQNKKTIKIKAVVIRDDKKQPARVIGVDLDMTYQLTAAGEINELNKMLEWKNRDLQDLNDELRTFNIVASRDYKETIQTLYTNLEYIVATDARNLSDASKANIRRAQSSIQRMKLLTEDINDYLQLYDIGIQVSQIDANLVINDVLSKMTGKIEQAGASIELTNLRPLDADPLLFSRLIAALLDNALKFRKLAVPLVIRIKSSQADEMNAVSEAIKNTPYAIISISDNGTGFKEEDAENIFDLFVRLHDRNKTRGSGIGLAVCKKIMAMHGGFITAEAGLATGSTFSCYFPVIKW